MRLTKFEIEIIKRVATEVWGNKTIIRLFGSRTDDSKKGGDIDLFIQPVGEQIPEKIMLQKSEFLCKLELLLGEQKIDVLVQTPYNKDLTILKTAELNGIVL